MSFYYSVFYCSVFYYSIICYSIIVSIVLSNTFSIAIILLAGAFLPTSVSYFLLYYY
jgi:hypothetical protein